MTSEKGVIDGILNGISKALDRSSQWIKDPEKAGKKFTHEDYEGSSVDHLVEMVDRLDHIEKDYHAKHKEGGHCRDGRYSRYYKSKKQEVMKIVIEKAKK